jgi:hypothetical protein
VDSPARASISFAGLAPGFVGLYQVNFTVPSSGLANGDVLIEFNTPEAFNEMATISLSGFPGGDARIVPSGHAISARSRLAASGAAFGGHPKNFRRALPER